MLTKNANVTAKFTGVDFSQYSSKISEFVNEFSSRANKKGQLRFPSSLIASKKDSF